MSASEKVFLDSNIVLYLLSDDATKANTAEKLLKEGATISVQVLNEVSNVARRKLGLAWSGVHVLLAAVRSNCTVSPVRLTTHEQGLHIAERFGLSIYDAMIVSAALEAQCEVLYSEDMQHGMVIDKKLKIVNPFVG